jgi:hypothetical protein
MSCDRILIVGFGFFGSGLDDFPLVAIHSFCDIPGIDEEGNELENPLIINPMICNDHGGIDPAKHILCKRGRFQLKRVFSERGKGWDIGIVIEKNCPFF